MPAGGGAAGRAPVSAPVAKSATGDQEEIKRYLRIFGNEAREAHKVYV